VQFVKGLEMKSTAKDRRRIRNLRIAAGSAAFLLAGVAIPLAIGGAEADPVSDEARYVTLINEARVAEGLKPLAVHPALVSAARKWADSMQGAWDPAANEICQISHNPNLRTAVDANWQKLGENVGCGDVDVDVLEQKFMESPKHRANIMDPTFDTVGIGIVMKGDVMFVTQQFMQMRSTPVTTAAGPPAALALKPTPTTVVGVVQTPKVKKGSKSKRRVLATPKQLN
jgi:uncharacterized protein YkwD